MAGIKSRAIFIPAYPVIIPCPSPHFFSSAAVLKLNAPWLPWKRLHCYKSSHKVEEGKETPAFTFHFSSQTME